MPFTEQDAIDMRDAMNLLQQKEQQQVQALYDTNIQIALTWWNTVKPTTPTTRDEAKDAFDFIEQLLKTETDRYRLIVLRKKLEEANQEFIERKANG